MIIIENNGPEIVKTNFWETEWNEQGRLYLSGNAGAFRLLVPDEHFHWHSEIQKTKEVVITQGIDRIQKKEMVEMLFDDHTDTPIAFWLDEAQIDREGDSRPEGFPFHVYLEGCFQVAKFTCFWRRAKKLPYLKPWKQ